MICLGGEWILLFVFIQASLSSFENYQSVLSVFKIPSYWFNAGVSSFSGGSFNLESMVNVQFSTINYNFEVMWDKGGFTNPLPIVLSGVYWLVGFMFLIVLIVMTVLSQFMANVILSLGALALPLVIWQPTKSVFFSWLRLYISLSLWAPFALLLSGIPTNAIQNIQQGYILTAKSDTLIYAALVSIVLMLFSIFLLVKIPAWVSAIIGSGDSDGTGSGLVGLAKMGTKILEYAKNKIQGKMHTPSTLKESHHQKEEPPKQGLKDSNNTLKIGKFTAKHTPFQS